MVAKIIEASGKKLKLEFDTSKPTIKFNLAVNADRARKKYNWNPQISLKEGIKKTIAWYKENIL